MKASLSFADTNEKAVRERNIKTRAIPICCYIIILRIFSVPYEGIVIVIEVKVADMALLFIREHAGCWWKDKNAGQLKEILYLLTVLLFLLFRFFVFLYRVLRKKEDSLVKFAQKRKIIDEF